jgi:hypothetical protein
LTLKLPKIGGAGGESGQRVGPKYPKNTDLTFPISPKIGARGCPDLEIKLGRPYLNPVSGTRVCLKALV